MAEIHQFKSRRQLQADELRKLQDTRKSVAADTATELVKEVMPHLISVYGSYGIRFNDTDRNYKHFSAIQILLYIHTCDQVGFEHPMIDYLDEISQEIDDIIKVTKAMSDPTNL